MINEISININNDKNNGDDLLYWKILVLSGTLMTIRDLKIQINSIETYGVLSG